MSLLSIAREQSRQRGYAYYTENRVTSVKKTGLASWAGAVRGSGEAEYRVSIDLERPKRSSCDCPFAAGRSRICKHMIALYFAVHPEEAERCRVELERRLAEMELEKKLQEEAELQQEEAVREYLSRMSKDELINLSISLLQMLPDWQYDYIMDELFDDDEDFEEDDCE